MKLGYKNVYREPKGFPEWQKMGLPIESDPTGATASVPQTPGPLHGWAMIWTLLGVFAGGMALNLTPCVYPLIPITVSYFGGQAANYQRGRGKLLIHGVCYMLGLAITNSTLGVVAALTGGLMGALLQNPDILVGIAVILVGFAASLFGLWELRLPSGLTQAAAKSCAGCFGGTLFIGLSLGIVAAACVGPFVLGLSTCGSAAVGSHRDWVSRLLRPQPGAGAAALASGRFRGAGSTQLPRAGGWMLTGSERRWAGFSFEWPSVSRALSCRRSGVSPCCSWRWSRLPQGSSWGGSTGSRGRLPCFPLAQDRSRD